MTPVAPWQIRWAVLDPTQGQEQAGTRPVLLVSSTFHLRLTRAGIVTVLPLTTRERPHLLHRVAIDIPGKRTAYAITEQVRTISADRLTDVRPYPRPDHRSPRRTTTNDRHLRWGSAPWSAATRPAAPRAKRSSPSVQQGLLRGEPVSRHSDR